MKKTKTIAVMLAAALLMTNIVSAKASVDVSNNSMVSLRGINRNPYKHKRRTNTTAQKAVPTPTANITRSNVTRSGYDINVQDNVIKSAPVKQSGQNSAGSAHDPKSLRRLMRRSMPRTATQNAVSLMTDGVLINNNLPVEFSGSEVLLPMDLISDVLGASYTWDEITRQFSISYKDKFIRLTQGSDAFLSGDYMFDEKGSADKVGKSALTLEAMPVVHNDRMYAPFKIIAKELGIEYSYSPEKKTVTIVSMPQNPAPTPAVPYPDSPAFRNLSGKRLQQLYETGVTFVALLYNSNDAGSADTIAMAKTAAETAGYRVYGVDVSAPDSELGSFGSTANRVLPAMIFCFSKNDVSYLENLTNAEEISSMISNVKKGAFFLPRPTGSYLVDSSLTPAATPAPAATPEASPEPTATPVPINQSSGNWNVITRDIAEMKFRMGEKFIYVCFNSAEAPLDDPSLLLIKEAADKANVPVFATDLKNNTGYWFGWDFTGYYTTPVPVVYFIRAQNSVTSEIRPKEVDRLADMMSTFK